MRFLSKTMALAALVSVQVAAGSFLAAGALTQLYAGKIVPGVYIGRLSASGVTLSSLARTAEEAFPGGSGRNLVLYGDGNEWTVPYTALDVTPNLDSLVTGAETRLDNGSPGALVRILRWLVRPVHLRPGFLYRHDLLADRLAAISRTTAVRPRNASLTLIAGQVKLVPGWPGRRLDIPATLQAAPALLPLAGERLPLVFAAPAPGVTSAELAPLKNLLGEYTTILQSGDANRNHNVALGTRLLNGALIQPGGEFSVNARLGPRLARKGFREAPAIVGSALVDQDGGGVCQIATTLYNAALLAGLKIIERYPHSLPVPYAPLGRDATINWDNLDLKLLNNTAHPIYIKAGVLKDRLSVMLFGESKPGRISVYTRVTTPDGGATPPLYELALGYAGPGSTSVTVYRRITHPDGRTTTETISQDYYHLIRRRPGYEK